MKTEGDGDIVELEAENVIFYSINDEQFFFEWLGGMAFVEDVVGRGSVIYIRINAREVTEDGLREILAFFQRYKISMRQLRRFDREDFSGWFRRSNAYWYRRVFKKLPNGAGAISVVHALLYKGTRVVGEGGYSNGALLQRPMTGIDTNWILAG